MPRHRTDPSVANVWPAFTDTIVAFVLAFVLAMTLFMGRQIELIPRDGPKHIAEDMARVDSVITAGGQFAIPVRESETVQLITLGASVLFPRGSAELSSEGQMHLDRLASLIVGSDGLRTLYKIEVSGHTDDVPITTAQFPSNWELSTQRAVNVVRFLERQGVNLRKLQTTAAGYGEFLPSCQPPSTLSVENCRQQNRRVELRLSYSYKSSAS